MSLVVATIECNVYRMEFSVKNYIIIIIIIIIIVIIIIIIIIIINLQTDEGHTGPKRL